LTTVFMGFEAAPLLLFHQNKTQIAAVSRK
jgi:hypothetical protein